MANTDLVQSVLKALDILETTAGEENGIRLNELSGRLGMKTATTHNLMRTLVARDFLVKQNNLYSLGPKMDELVNKRNNRQLLQKIGDTILILAEEFPLATFTATEISYSELVVRLRLSPDRPGILQQPLNQTFMPYSSIAGLLHMALAADEMESVLAHYLFNEYGLHIWKNEKNLNEYLATARKNKHATGDFIDKEGFRVAVPIFSSRNQLLFTLGAALKVPNVTENEKNKLICSMHEIISAL